MWSDLLSDVLMAILAFVSLTDIAAVAAVCAPWHQAAKRFAREQRLSVRHLPWIITSRHPETRAAALLRPLGSLTAYSLRRCCGVHGHWLAVAEETGRLFLLHPLLRNQIPLPPQFTLLTRVSHYKLSYLVRKVILSSLPTEEQCMVAIIFGNGEMSVCRLGDCRWTNFESGIRRERLYQDAVFYNGELIAVDTKQKVWGFRFQPGWVTIRLLAQTASNAYYSAGCDDRYSLRYLMVVCGKLVMAVRERTAVFDRSGHFGQFRTTNFRILQMESDGTHWSIVRTLGDNVMFLSRSISVTVAADEIRSHFLPDSVYFTEPDTRRPGKPEDSGWYHLPCGFLRTDNGLGAGCNRPRRVPIFNWMFDYSKLF